MKQHILDTIDLRVLGQALQKARKQRGMKQADAAKVIHVSRTTMTAIEKGTRRIKAGELIKLARAYGKQVSDFVRSRPQIAPFPVQFRGPHKSSSAYDAQIVASVESLQELCRDYLELEQIMGLRLIKNYPVEYKVKNLRTVQAAEYVANSERKRLGLGDGPLANFREVLEQDVGLRVFYLPLQPSTYSEIYYYDNQLGGCLAINKLHPEGRRRWSMAHGYAHFLVHRYRPTATVNGYYNRKPESERFADYFAYFFLMPTTGLMERFRQISDKPTLANLARLAQRYGVSMEAFMSRLEDMRLIPSGAWEKLKQRGLKVKEVQKKLGLGEIPGQDELLPQHYVHLAVNAFEDGLISEGRLMRYLRTDRLTARDIVEAWREEMEEFESEIPVHLDLMQALAI